MSRTRFFILLAGSFLLVSAAWADELGYVDCSAHPENTQVFGKPRQTPDSVATVACGERFTILLNGFIFSRVQTKDGKIGYVYSSLITADHGQAGPAPSAAGRAPAASAPAASAANVRPAVANAATVAPAYAQPASASQAASMPVTTSLPPEKPAAPAGPLFPTPPMPAVTAADVNYSSPAQAAPATFRATASTPAASAQAAPAVSQPVAPSPAPSAAPVDSEPAAKPAPAAIPSASASVTPAASAPAAQGSTTAAGASAQPANPAFSQPSAPAPAPAATEPQPSASSTASQSSVPAQPGPLFPTTPPPAPSASSTPDPAPAPAPAAAEPAPASQPQPEAAQPAPEPVRSAKARESWEQPVAGAHQGFLLELYSGYAFARFVNAGTSANLSGGLGSFGWNLKPWLQLVGDSSYNFATTNGAKSVLYGNHFGGRAYYRRGRFGMGRIGVTPFAEALVGGSRLDTTVTGPGGFKTSVNCISYKAGGGIDVHFSPHWEVRLINVDFYRTTFRANGYSAAQNSYWASAGVVLRLFGAHSE